MRRSLMIAILGVFFLLLSTPMDVSGEEYSEENLTFMGEYMSEGTLVEGSSLNIEHPYIDYTFSDVTMNGKKIKDDEMSLNDIWNDAVASSGFTYEFDINVPIEYSMLQTSAYDATDEGIQASLTDNNGILYTGLLYLTPTSQVIHTTYHPEDDITSCMYMTVHIETEYTFVDEASGEKFTGELTYETEYSPAFSEYADEEVKQQIGEALGYGDYVILTTFTDSKYIELILENNSNLSFQASLKMVPIVFEGGKIIHAYSAKDGYDYSAESSEDTTTTKKNETPDKLALALKVAVMSVVTVGVVAGASAVGSMTSGDNGTIMEALTKKLEEKKTFYELEINGGVDLIEVVCEKGKSLEIPVRVAGGENEQWIFTGISLCEKNHKKVIHTVGVFSGNGTGLVTLFLQGNEVEQKETIQCTITALNPQKLAQVMVEVFEFDMVPEKVEG